MQALTTEQERLLEQANPGASRAGLASKLQTLITAVNQAGQRAVNVLALGADVVDQDTFTIGNDTFEISVLTTDSTQTVSGGELNNTNASATVTITSHGLAVGDLFRVENEIMKVTGVISANQVSCRRGHSGTTVATHANGTAIYTAAQAVGAGNIPVGLNATLTPAAAGPAIVAVVNGDATVSVTLSDPQANGTELLMVADQPGAVALACTETFTNAGDEFAAAVMYGGAAKGEQRMVVQTRAAKAVEVTAGRMRFAFDFVPTVISAGFVVTATPGVAVAWDGAVTVSGNTVELDNGGVTDFSASHTAVLIVTG